MMLRRVRFVSVAWWRYLAVLLFLWIPWLCPLPADAQFTHIQITNLVGGGVDSFSPSINAAGTRIAFISNGNPTGGNADGNDELFLWIQGTGITQITNTTKGSNESPSINSDGTRIAFMSDRDLTGDNGDGSNEIFLWVEGSGFTQITNSSVASESPSINADGTKIAFWSRSDPVGTNVDGNEEIFLWTSPSTITQITTTTGGWGSANLAPSINGDGTRIAFWSSVLDTPGPGFEDTGGDIFLWTSGSGISQITNTSGGGQNLAPSINGDGTRIAFTSSRNPDGGPPDGDTEVFLWISGSGITQITDTVGGDSVCPSINSDGTRIAFCYTGDLTGDNADGNREIFLWIEGSGFTQVTNTTGGFNASPSINAAGTRIAFESNRDLTPAPGGSGNSDANEEIFLSSDPASQAAAVPTLSEWAQIGMAGLLVGAGLLAIRRHRQPLIPD